MEIEDVWNDCSNEPKSISDDLTSLTWLQNINILTVPGPPTPPASPKPTGNKKGGKNNPLKEVDLTEFRTIRTDKPPFSYATMICMAMKANKNKMTLSSIYSWIKENFLYYRRANPVWQNSIRHNLSLNRCFMKIPRSKDEPGKGGFWRLDPVYAESLDNGAKLYRLRKRRNNTKTKGKKTLSENEKSEVGVASHLLIAPQHPNSAIQMSSPEQEHIQIQHSCDDISCIENQTMNNYNRVQEMEIQLQAPSQNSPQISYSTNSVDCVDSSDISPGRPGANIIQHVQHHHHPNILCGSSSQNGLQQPTVTVLENVQMQCIEAIDATHLVDADFFNGPEVEPILTANGEYVYVLCTSSGSGASYSVNQESSTHHSHNSENGSGDSTSGSPALPSSNAIYVPTNIENTVEIPMEGGSAVLDNSTYEIAHPQQQQQQHNSNSSNHHAPCLTTPVHNIQHHPTSVSEVIELSSMDETHYQIQVNNQHGLSQELSSIHWDDRCNTNGLNFFESVLDLDELISIGEL